MANKKSKSKKLNSAFESFKKDFIGDESITVETKENLYYSYAIPTQKMAKYSLIGLITEQALNLTF